MRATKTLAALLAVGILLGLCAAADAATFTGGSAPAVDGADIAQLTGNTDLGGDNAHMWPNRPAHGQSFTTGGDPSGYWLNAVTLKRTDGNVTNSTYNIRVGTVSGSAFAPVLSVQSTGMTGSGPYGTWTFDSPLALTPNTLYAFDVGMPSGSGWRVASTNWGQNPYAGGQAASSGDNGVGTGTLWWRDADRNFHVDMTPAPPNPYEGAVRGDGPVVYYRLNEGAGSATAASIGSDGTFGGAVNGAITFGTGSAFGALGTAANLGTNGYIVTGPATGGDPSGNIGQYLCADSTASLEFWMKTTQDGNRAGWNAYALSGADNSKSTGGGGGTDLWWGTNWHGKIGIAYGDNHADDFATSTALNDNAWHHVVITRNGANVNIYVDGNATPDASYTNFTTGTGSYKWNEIGRNQGLSGSHFNSAIDEVAIYNYVLSGQDAADHYAAAQSAGGIWIKDGGAANNWSNTANWLGPT